MKYVVTGGGGFIGSHIIKALKTREPEADIVAYQRSANKELKQMGVAVVQGDLGDPAALSRICEGADTVFHVAARAGIWGSWEDFYQPNVIGTRNVLYACNSGGVKHLIYTSTPSVVFGGKPIRGEDESLPYPESWPFFYGHTKALAEASVLEANQKPQQGVQTIALRPHLVWGPGDPHIIPRVLQRARAGRLRIVGDGSNRVDITHVDNVVAGHLAALGALREGRAGGRAFFLSDDKPVLLWDWINMLLEGLDIPVIEKRVSLETAQRIGGVLEWVYRTFRLKGEPPMTRFTAMQLGEDHWFNVSAAKDQLGYRPVMDNETGVRNLIEYCKAAGV